VTEAAYFLCFSELQLVDPNSGRVGRHHARDTRSRRSGLYALELPACAILLGTTADMSVVLALYVKRRTVLRPRTGTSVKFYVYVNMWGNT